MARKPQHQAMQVITEIAAGELVAPRTDAPHLDTNLLRPRLDRSPRRAEGCKLGMNSLYGLQWGRGVIAAERR